MFIGTAGWTIPRAAAAQFADDGSHLVRYARVFNAVEINSSFHRPHRPTTYARWAESVPSGFHFSVKVPKLITHEHRLVDCDALFANFLDTAKHLGDRLGPLLVQLPPSLHFAPQQADFFAAMRARHEGAVVCEPRHASWFTAAADAMLARFTISRVLADPAPHGVHPLGPLTYVRLHGAPRMYYSAYDDAALDAWGQRLARAGDDAWCIFDNTAHGAATTDALSLRARVAR